VVGLNAMAPWLEWGLVLVLVVASAVFAVWRLMPAAWRLRWQVRFGWRAGSGNCGCDACPTTKPTNANSVTPAQ